MLIHTKDLNFIQPVLEEYCLKIQAVATNSCTFLQQPFIEPPPPRVGSSKGQAFTTVTVQPTGWPSGPDSLVSTHAPKRLRRSLPFPTPLSSPISIHNPSPPALTSPVLGCLCVSASCSCDFARTRTTHPPFSLSQQKIEYSPSK